MISLTQLRLRPSFIKLSEIWRDNLMLFSFVTELSISWVVLMETYQNGISFTRLMLDLRCKYSRFACHFWEWHKDQQPFYLRLPVKFLGLDIQSITQRWLPLTWWSDALRLRMLNTKSESTPLLQATSDLKLLEAIRISKMLWLLSKTKASSEKQP